MKLCTQCKTEKPLTAFNRNGERYRSICKECEKIKAKIKRQNPEYRKQQLINHKVWREKNQEKMRLNRRESEKNTYSRNSERYIKKQIAQRIKIKIRDIPQELIDLKSIQLKIGRAIHEARRTQETEK